MTIVCIASGPSLTAEDCALVERSGHPTVAVNDSWRLARFARWLFAGDIAWWRANINDVDIPAERWACMAQAASTFGINHFPAKEGWHSGQMALLFALAQKPRRVLLLGYDCSLAHGVHWHGPHKRTTNPDQKKVRRWLGQYARAAREARQAGVEVLNCSRRTELDWFPRVPLEEALAWTI